MGDNLDPQVFLQNCPYILPFCFVFLYHNSLSTEKTKTKQKNKWTLVFINWWESRNRYGGETFPCAMLTAGRLFYCPETERGERVTLVGSRIYAKKNRMHLRGVRMYAQGGEIHSGGDKGT